MLNEVRESLSSSLASSSIFSRPESWRGLEPGSGGAASAPSPRPVRASLAQQRRLRMRGAVARSIMASSAGGSLYSSANSEELREFEEFTREVRVLGSWTGKEMASSKGRTRKRLPCTLALNQEVGSSGLEARLLDPFFVVCLRAGGCPAHLMWTLHPLALHCPTLMDGGVLAEHGAHFTSTQHQHNRFFWLSGISTRLPIKRPSIPTLLGDFPPTWGFEWILSPAHISQRGQQRGSKGAFKREYQRSLPCTAALN